MEKFPNFPNPPIVEALLDIRTVTPTDIDLSDLEMIHEKVRDRFPKKAEKRFFSSKIKLPNSDNYDVDLVQNESGIEGFFFESEGSEKIFQARINGFTFNKLAPYQDWKIFSEEGLELWDLYFKAAKPDQINQIGLRYINRIEIPLPFNEFSDYILTKPQIAEGVPQDVSSFFMRLEIPNQEIKANAIIIQAIETPTQEQKLPLIFDIHVSKNREYINDVESLWSDLEALKVFENQVFFKSITDKTKELFR